MKKKQFYGVLLLMAVMAFSLLSCSSSDDNDDLVSPISRSGNVSISGTWMLSGYISDGVYKDMKPFAGFITLEENGHFLCKIGNELQGSYEYVSSNGNFSIKGCGSTKVLFDNEDVSFVESLIFHKKIISAECTGDGLKLFYSDKDYILFKSKI